MDQSLFVAFADVLASLKDLLEGSFLFNFLRFFLFVYTAVLLVDIVLLFLMRDVAADLRLTLKGARLPTLPRGKAIRRWEGIRSRLTSGNPSQYKAAVLEADAFADDMLRNMGYKGANMRERLDQITPAQIESKPDLEAGHALRNRIIHEPGLEVSRELAEETIDRYRRFLNEIELFS
jgi:hypothetical protein